MKKMMMLHAREESGKLRIHHLRNVTIKTIYENVFNMTYTPL
jgi:hypothetical protein